MLFCKWISLLYHFNHLIEFSTKLFGRKFLSLKTVNVLLLIISKENFNYIHRLSNVITNNNFQPFVIQPTNFNNISKHIIARILSHHWLYKGTLNTWIYINSCTFSLLNFSAKSSKKINQSTNSLCFILTMYNFFHCSQNNKQNIEQTQQKIQHKSFGHERTLISAGSHFYRLLLLLSSVDVKS